MLFKKRKKKEKKKKTYLSVEEKIRS